MARLTKTLNVRFAPEELRRLRRDAKVRGWSVGRLIRFRVLGEDRELDERVAALEHKVRAGRQ